MSEDAERAQWEAASRVRAQRDAEAAARAQVVSAPDEDPDGRGGRRPRRVVVAVAVVAVCVVAVAVVLVAIRHRSAQQPSWVAQLGLDRPAEGDGQATTGTGFVGPVNLGTKSNHFAGSPFLFVPTARIVLHPDSSCSRVVFA